MKIRLARRDTGSQITQIMDKITVFLRSTHEF